MTVIEPDSGPPHRGQVSGSVTRTASQPVGPAGAAGAERAAVVVISWRLGVFAANGDREGRLPSALVWVEHGRLVPSRYLLLSRAGLERYIRARVRRVDYEGQAEPRGSEYGAPMR
jgi:hypothetical protein